MAWTLVLALLCQVLLGVPLAVEMTAGHAGGHPAAHDHAVECEGGESAPAPAPKHDHQKCVICQTALTPSLTAPVVLAVLVALAAAPVEIPAPLPFEPAAAALAYHSRAPPAKA